MNLQRTIRKGAAVCKKLLNTSSFGSKTYCSNGNGKNNVATMENFSSDYFNAYQRVYEGSDLFKNPGTLRNQQLTQDYVNIQKQNIQAGNARLSERPESLDEESDAMRYYNMYHELFCGWSDGPETETKSDSEASQNKYYDEYRKIFQQPDTFLSSEKSVDKLTHTNEEGHLKMVDVGSKPDSKRFAKASGKVYLGEKAFHLVQENKLKKGDVLNTAKIAGIMACKRTSQLIPLCHPLPISNVNLEVTLNAAECSVSIECGVQTTGKTGVEMEALTGVSVAALTVYDMCKAVSHDIIISQIQLLEKYGGVSGSYIKQ